MAKRDSELTKEELTEMFDQPVRIILSKRDLLQLLGGIEKGSDHNVLMKTDSNAGKVQNSHKVNYIVGVRDEDY